MLGIWKESFLKILDYGVAGESPIDKKTPLEHGFMKINDETGLLYIWDSKNKVKGVIHRVKIPKNAPLIELINNFLPDYKWVK